MTKEELKDIEERLHAARIYQDALTRLQELLRDLRALADTNLKYCWDSIVRKAYSTDVKQSRHGLLLDSAFLTNTFNERLQALVVEEIERMSNQLRNL